MLANITCILQFRHSPNLKLIYVIYCHTNFYFVTCVCFIISNSYFGFKKIFKTSVFTTSGITYIYFMKESSNIIFCR